MNNGEKEFYEGQNSEHQQMIRGIVAAPFYNFDVANLFFYQDLSEEDKRRLANIARNRLTSSLALEYAKLTTEEKEYLRNLSPEKREALNRYLASGSTGLATNNNEFYQALSSDEKRVVDKIRRDVAYARGALALGLFGEGGNGENGEISDGLTEEEKLSKIISEDIVFYNNLSSEDRKVVDRIIAIQLVESAYKSNPDLYVQDTRYYESLDKDEKEIIKRLARELNNSDVNSPQITDSQLNYYQNMAIEKRSKVNRLVVREAVKAKSVKDVKLSSSDNNFLEKLSKEEKSKVERIAKIRTASRRIMTNDLELEFENMEDNRVVAEVSTFKVGDFDNVSIGGKLYEIYTGNPAYGVEIPLLNDKGEIVKITSTNKDGSFKYLNLPAGQSYSILSQAEAPSITTPQKYFIKGLKIEGMNRENVVNTGYDNIYYDLAKFELRPEAKSVLDELAKITKEYSEVQIEINAYTDNTGSDEFNLELSAKRGRAAFDYLVSRGTDRTAIVINPRGKSNPIASNTNNFGRQFNRRVEFILTGSGLKVDIPYVTFITKPGATFSKVAKAHEMAEEELRRLNGQITGNLQAFKPIRIKEGVKIDTELLFERSATTDRVTYTVKRGDTVYSLSNRFGITQEVLMQTNNLDSPQDLRAGQVLTIYQGQ